MSPAILLTGLAAVAMAVLLFRYNRSTVAASYRDWPAPGEFMDTDGRRLHYVCRGEGAPVVCFHGAAGTLHDFDWVLPRLSEEFRVCAFDRPGHGWSEPLPRSLRRPDVQVHLFKEAVDRLGLERPVLVGYSWGGALALQYALEYPESTGAVVVIGGTTHIGTAPRNPLYWILRTPGASHALLTFGLVPIGKPYVGVPLRNAFRPDPIPREYLDRARATWVRPNAVRAMTDDFHELDGMLRLIRHRYPELAVPVVILTGDHDRLVDADRNSMVLAREAPDAELIVVPGAGHALPQIRVDAVVDGVRRAVRKREGKG